MNAITDNTHNPELTTPLPKESQLLVPTYQKDSQLDVTDLDTLYPDWRAENAQEDAELILFDFVRTQEKRRLGSLRQVQQDLAPEGVEKAILQMPDEVGSEFQAHGIAGKYGSSSSELDALLRKGIDPSRHLYSTQLRQNIEAGGAIGADMPFTMGGLVVVGNRGAQLEKEGIRYVIVGEEYLDCFDVMQSRYPDVTLIPWHEAPRFFCDIVNEAQGTNYSPKLIDYAKSYEIGENDNLPGGTLGSVAVGQTITAIPHPIILDDSDDPAVW